MTDQPTLDIVTSVESTKVDEIVLGVTQDGDALRLAGPYEPAGLPHDLSVLGALADPNTAIRIPGTTTAKVVTLVGIGSAPFDAETLRRAAGTAVRTTNEATSVLVALPVASALDAQAVTEGALFGSYRFTRYAGVESAAKPKPHVTTIKILVPDDVSSAANAGKERALVVAASVAATRNLVNSAPNDLYPESFAAFAKEFAKVPGIKITVMDEKALTSGGFGGLIGVGQGSARPPRLVKVAYKPAKAKTHIALVGKGITFDSGGISIKPAKGMEAMKSDMSGAAAVLGTVVATAKLKSPVAVTGWLCLAENMPSGTATRPSDILTIRGGKTVEVLNTDAEGRLVLADGLVAAVEESPDAVIDVATLTGAQIVALGHHVAGVMGTDALRAQVINAAATSGEAMWPMPLPVELKPSFASKVADLANIGDRMGGMLVAGLFLQEFVGDTPWAHLDIAGPAFNEFAAHGYTPQGGTGFSIRTLLTLIEEFAHAD